MMIRRLNRSSSSLRRSSIINISCRNVYTEEEKQKYLSVKPYTLPNHHKVSITIT